MHGRRISDSGAATTTRPTNEEISHRAMSVGDGKPSGATENGTIGEPMPRKRLVATGRVTCRWLYNQAQASRGIILIDTRPLAEYEEDTIPSAISVPPMPQCRTLEDVEEGISEDQRYLFSSKKRKLRDVVLFGDAVKMNSNSPKNDGSDGTCWLQQLEKLITADGQVMSVKTLTDGFLTFKYRYPFFTTSAILDEMSTLARTQSGTHNVNYPNEILDGFLFLGNMWHAQSKKVIRHLGITHIVNASLDIENVFEHDGVKYHEVKIKDRVESDISTFFDSTYAFIESAKRMQHARVLVHCTQGISRSATLVIMYLMRAHHWSLVTAVNYALASRGVVYPNQGFMRCLMQDEFRQYKGNSLTPDEVDILLQHQIPDRPIPLQIHDQKSETCSKCCKVFGLLEWKHRCSHCRKEYCSKCTSTRLAIFERERESNPYEEIRRGRRVCDSCVRRLWEINLPRPRKSSRSLRGMRTKQLYVNSMSTFGKQVCITYFEGTDNQVILDLITIRFDVQTNQIVDIATDTGDPVQDLISLPDDSVVMISVGNAGVQDVPQRQKLTNGYGRRYQALRDHNAALKDHIEIGERLSRGRFSSEGNMVSLMDQTEREETRRSNSFHLDRPAEFSAQPAIDPKQAETKFRELWNLSFPSLGLIDRSELLSIQNPMLLTDVMLGISGVASGATTLQSFEARLSELGYLDHDRELVMRLLKRSLTTKAAV
ncbi:hypothetical protein Poli38472_002959 [Pythium oligandrum]|uniref:Dual specificity phosphatase n=1 Tax=Pythium oligandrum TaxID=41045 RepID=A0A8K1C5W6_PYTOL|nr:hypothetical protein Poli38472_002959 [Pythium oligandrum]|eukprot:TMW57034.1 hypothetical protein Poli38472_002959 [Pythium oligandrum]